MSPSQIAFECISSQAKISDNNSNSSKGVIMKALLWTSMSIFFVFGCSTVEEKLGLKEKKKERAATQMAAKDLNMEEKTKDDGQKKKKKKETETDVEVAATGITLTMNGLPHLNSQHYEGWIIVDDMPYSTGRFNINGLGGIDEVDASGAVLSELSRTATITSDLDATGASAFVLTIEPNGDDDSAPSDIHVLAGDIADGKATAVTAHGAAIATDFQTVDGDFILATPTNDASTNNQGIWWLDPTAGPAATLVLPELATGWVYEGWVVDVSDPENPVPVSTGRFLSAAGEDEDGAGSTAGPNGFPPFPGQDFIDPALVLNDGNHIAVITVEPEFDPDPAPFFIKILKGEIADGAATAPSLHGMDRIYDENAVTVQFSMQ